MTIKECAFFDCARMILLDQCPPDRTHYLCMQSEDDADGQCAQCWDTYLWGIMQDAIELPLPKGKKVTA
ncbi:MAG: hypothetical protein HFF73_05450 [Oscillospiraceae bacterium]|nr:hypothetical protein [Oscillospiraceae bacterium]